MMTSTILCIKALRHNTVRSGAIYQGQAGGRKKKIRPHPPLSSPPYSVAWAWWAGIGPLLEELGLEEFMGEDLVFFFFSMNYTC